MSGPVRQFERLPVAAIERVVADPLACQVYLAILVLPGVHAGSGWLGTRRGFVSELSSVTGKEKNRKHTFEIVKILCDCGAIACEERGGAYCVKVGSQNTQGVGSQNPQMGSQNTQVDSVATHPVPPMVSPTPPSLPPSSHQDHKAQTEIAPRARGRDIAGGRIPVRNGRLTPRAEWPADGLAEALAAAGLRFSPRQVDLLVADAGNGGPGGAEVVKRQLAWLPRRDSSWWTAPGGPGLEAMFRKLCREDAPEPASGDGGTKPLLSADAVAVLRAELRDRRVSKGAVARALASVGAPDLEHLTAESRRALLAALEAS